MGVYREKSPSKMTGKIYHKILSVIVSVLLLLNSFAGVFLYPQEVLAADTIITDDDAIYLGTWTDYPTQGYLDTGVHYPTVADSGQTATWDFSSITSGFYRVYISWSTHSNRTTLAPYTLNHVDGEFDFEINQELLADQATLGGSGEWSGWYEVGYYNLDENSSVVLTSIENTSGTDHVIADETKLVLNEPPSLPLLTWPIGGIHINDNTPLMQWEDSTDDDGIAGYNYRVYYNCSNVLDIPGSCGGPYEHSSLILSSELQAGPTSPGTYFWQVRAKDNVGNMGDWSEFGEVTIDTTKPVITLDAPVNDSILGGTINLRAVCNEDCDYINFWWRAEGEEYRADSKRYHYVYDDGTEFEWGLDTLSAEKWDNTTYPMSDGVYYLYAAGKDLAGNWARTPDVKVTVDNTRPTADIVFPIPGPFSTNFQVEFSEDVATGDAENPSNYFLNNWPGVGGSGDLVGDALITYDSLTRTSTVTFTNPIWYISPEQEWGVQDIHDLAGNLLNPNPTTETSTLMIPPTLPGIPETSPNPTNSTSQEWNWTPATDAGGSGVKGYYSQVYDVDGDSLGIWNWLGNVLGTTTNLGEGSWQLSVKAEDRAGNQSGEAESENLVVDTTAPSSFFTLPLDEGIFGGPNEEPVSILGHSTDMPVETVAYTELYYRESESEDEWLLLEIFENTLEDEPFNWEMGWIPEEDGAYDFKAVATDKAGNIEETAYAYSVIYDTTVPSLSWTSPVEDTVISGTTVILSVVTDNLSGVESVAYHYQRDGEAEWHEIAILTNPPYEVSWDTTGLGLDNYNLRAGAKDNAGNLIEIIRQVGVAAVVSEENSTTPTQTTAIITWVTDRPTSSRVVYDTVGHSVLDSLDPNYGYAYSTGTLDTSPKVINHSVEITGLSDGTPYYYRTISAGSPAAVGGQRSFRTLTYAGAPAPSGGGAVAGATTQVLGVSTPGYGSGIGGQVLGEDEASEDGSLVEDDGENGLLGNVFGDSNGSSNLLRNGLIGIGALLFLRMIYFFFKKRDKNSL